MTARLDERHWRSLRDESGISPEVIEERGYVTINEKDGTLLSQLGFGKYQRSLPGLLVPSYDLTGALRSYQYRPDKPRIKSDGKAVKYENKPGVSPFVDVPRPIREQISQPSVDLWITEGAKKADAAVSHGLCCVSLPGVWAFRRKKDGVSETIPDLDEIPLMNRRVVVCFDSDVIEKREVQRALSALADELASRGARVEYALLSAADGNKRGLDDFLAAGGKPQDIRTVQPEHIHRDVATDGARPSGLKSDQAAEIVRIAVAAGVDLWRDESGAAFASFQKNDHRENAKCDSAEFQGFLFAAFRKEAGKAPSIRALQEAAQRLGLVARHEGPVFPTSLRIHRTDTESFLYLGDAGGRVVRIDARGWRLLNAEEDTPVRFLRTANGLGLPEPVTGGSLNLLRDVLSVSDTGFEFVVAWLLGCFLPKGGVPILLATGEQGSGKTSGCRYIRSVVDPNRMPLRNLSRDARGLAAAVRANFVLGYDNVSRVPHDLSDLLCSVSTGLGIASHALYTDNDEVAVAAWAPMILNGIGEIATRADLLDRSLPVPFLRIDGTGRRRSEADLEREFQSIHARVLGALLDRVATAYRNLPNLPLVGELPRHADLGAWVTASESNEVRGGFLSLLRATRVEQGTDALDGDLLALGIADLVREEGAFEGSASDILRTLNDRLDLTDRPRGWPQNPAQLASRLQRLAPTLRQVGISVEQGSRTAKRRTWCLGRLVQARVQGTGDSLHDGATPSPHQASPHAAVSLRSEHGASDSDDSRDGLLRLPLDTSLSEDAEWEAIR